MPIYTMEVVCQVLTIQADNENQAEAKYAAHFEGDDCPCGAEDCDCVDDQEDVYHNTNSDEEQSPEILVADVEKALWDLQYEAQEAKTFETPTQADYEKFLDRDFESDEYYEGAIWALRMILEKHKEAK